jgi:hypothetical protein
LINFNKHLEFQGSLVLAISRHGDIKTEAAGIGGEK